MANLNQNLKNIIEEASILAQEINENAQNSVEVVETLTNAILIKIAKETNRDILLAEKHNICLSIDFKNEKARNWVKKDGFKWNALNKTWDKELSYIPCYYLLNDVEIKNVKSLKLK